MSAVKIFTLPELVRVICEFSSGKKFGELSNREFFRIGRFDLVPDIEDSEDSKENKQNIFFEAIRSGNLESVIHIFNKYNDIDINMEELDCLDSFEKFNIMRASIFRNTNIFTWACIDGSFEIVKWLVSLGNINTNYSHAFISVCEEGNIDIAKWLYENPDIDIDIYIKNISSFYLACRNGHLKLAQWLYSVANINISDNNYRLIRNAMEGNLLIYNHPIKEWISGIQYIERTKHMSYNAIFKSLCCVNNTVTAKWLMDEGKLDDISGIFIYLCNNNYSIKIIKWFQQISNIDINSIDNFSEDVFIQICQNGELDKAQYLHSLGGVDVNANDDAAFRIACQYGHFELVRWLHSLGSVNINAIDDIAFYFACSKGHGLIARWLHSLGGVNIHFGYDDVFGSACYHGHESIAQWLYSLGGVDIHANNDYAFKSASRNGHESIARWLCKISNTELN